MSILANKHRPKVLDDLIGQPTIVTTIKNAVKANKLHHAYLFTGMFGGGKTTISRIIAAMVNCLDSPGVHPCGKCDNCVAIYNGTHNDIEEIDAASNAGGVKEVRKLKEAALYNPVAGAKQKIFIIDECLPYDSLVEMSDGSFKKIGFLVEKALTDTTILDDLVTSFDPLRQEKFAQKIIRYIKIPNNKEMFEIKIRDENGDIKTLKITANHSVFVADEKIYKVKTQDLKIGQKVILSK